MSSAVLYLAIVAVWAVVLVPMWLRRDGEATGVTRFLHKKGGEETDDSAVPDAPSAAVPHDDTPEPPRVERRTVSRATVIARRRRRTAGLALLFLTTATVTVVGAAPWWIVTPPLLLLAGHLALLRAAVQMDADRRVAAARHHDAVHAREADPPPAEIPDAAPRAEVIELLPTLEEEVFDQFADDRRAVGE